MKCILWSHIRHWRKPDVALMFIVLYVCRLHMWLCSCSSCFSPFLLLPWLPSFRASSSTLIAATSTLLARRWLYALKTYTLLREKSRWNKGIFEWSHGSCASIPILDTTFSSVYGMTHKKKYSYLNSTWLPCLPSFYFHFTLRIFFFLYSVSWLRLPPQECLCGDVISELHCDDTLQTHTEVCVSNITSAERKR